MSFKYRFIISFVLLEIFFILLIVTMNFITIKNSSEQLIKQKINSNMSFIDQMIRVPISIYDLASLDNLSNNTADLEYINSIVILDNQNRVLSQTYNFKHLSQKELLENQNNQTIELSDNTYEIRYKKIKEEDTPLGSFYVIFDTSDNFQFINKNKKNTAFIILIEILISTYLSFFIGNRLTTVLTRLSEVAEDIGENKETDIPFQERKDEIGILSKSMNKMQIDLKQRNDRLKDFAKELNQQKNELILANKAKDDFLANMSHELKTPLNSINVISSIMMKNTKKALNAEQVKNLSIINNCGNDLLFLINDVLDLSKLEAGEIQLVKETLHFKSTMNEIKAMFEPQMTDKGIEFIFKYDDTIEYIYSDEQRIKQVVKNLLSNALKFAQKGMVSLIVENQDNKVLIQVKDNGIGIAQDKLEHIFDRFKQVDESTTRNYGGTGLGLAICKELSHLLGGHIHVDSQENVGTTFSVTIDKNRDNIDMSRTLQAISSNNHTKVETPSTEQIIVHNSHDILILNNDPINFIRLIVELKKEHTIIQSDSITHFLEDYQNNKNIDLAIIDASLMSSSSLEKVIHKLPVKFILIYENELDNIEDEKIIYKIQKPFNPEDVIQQLIEHKESHESV